MDAVEIDKGLNRWKFNSATEQLELFDDERQ